MAEKKMQGGMTKKNKRGTLDQMGGSAHLAREAIDVLEQRDQVFNTKLLADELCPHRCKQPAHAKLARDDRHVRVKASALKDSNRLISSTRNCAMLRYSVSLLPSNPMNLGSSPRNPTSAARRALTAS